MRKGSSPVVCNHLEPRKVSILERRIKIGPVLVTVVLALAAGIGSQAWTPSPYFIAKRWAAEGAAFLQRTLGKERKISPSDLTPPRQALDTVLLPLIKQ